MLTTAAFNALLKTLEEPPTHVKFIFATTEIYKVPMTILSRCQHFEFFPLEAGTIAKHLRHIVDTEHLKAGEEALQLIAQLADGGMRDAQSMLDQLLTFSEGNLTTKAVQSMYGLLPADDLKALGQAIEQSNYATILQKVDQIIQSGCDAYRVLLDLERHFHTQLLTAIAHKGQVAFGPSVYTKLLEILKMSEEQLQRGLSVRSNLEAILFRAASASQWASLETLMQLLNTTLESVKKNAS